jgi:3-oxoacyl-[acyl-carrier-protein] synthase-3
MTAVDCGLSALGYYLPPQERSVSDIVNAGRSNSSADKLLALGFERIRIADEETGEWMAVAAVRDLERRTGFDLERVDAIIYSGALGTSSVILSDEADRAEPHDPTPLFRFPGCYLQAELGLPNASVIGVAQLACNTFQAALRTARALLASEPELDHILCVAADRFPRDARREIVYNLMSDGACAAVVSRGHSSNRILSATQITRGAYWDGTVSHDQLIAAYFPLARKAIVDAVERAGIGIDALRLLIPHNLNLKSWSILAQVVGIPLERIYTRNIARIGHVVASDNVINYVDAVAEGRVARGDHVALFVMGFGAHWSCTVVQA